MSYALGAVQAPQTQRTPSKQPLPDSDIPPYDKRRPGESQIPSERIKQREGKREFEELMRRDVPRRTAPPPRSGPRIPFPRRPIGGPSIGGSIILIPEILKEAVKVITRKPPEPGIRTLPRRLPPAPPAEPPPPRTQPERPEAVPEVRPPQVAVPRPLPEPPAPPTPRPVEFPTPTPSVPSGLPAPSTATAPAPISPLPTALIALAGLELLLRDRSARERSQSVTLPGDVVVAQPTPEPDAEPAPVGSPAISPLPAPAPLPKTEPRRLTPVSEPQVCFPDPAACRKAKEQRKKERDAKCNAFIKIPVRAHKKAVCVQDLAKYLLRKFKSKAKSRVRDELKKHGIVLVKKPRRPKLPDIEVGGGVEIDVGDLIKGK